MYLSRRMQSGSYAVYRQGLAEVIQTYNKVERKTCMNPCRTITLFGRECSNQMSPLSLKLSNPVNAGKYSKMQSSPSNPWFNLPSWGRWLIGSAIPVVLSFWNNNRMQKLKRIKGEAELVVEGMEAVAEMVEKVATATEDMAEVMEKNLPEQSKLKQVAVVLEHISEVAAHEAHLTHDFLHKVEKVAQDLDELEAMIEHLVDKSEANAETKQQKGDEENSEPSRH
ncbi:unnamed protein product [Eruca vesicaria subsp. sativa]|uniref:Uncharacterized protein n=1 Tax=Eruca vesicaria subsp. sativa TaxID=29727 RepID=A0ABC8LVN3_ERUVS|nr:unnamed protein product [Eruca vesicaria subsp. sativa]